MNDPDRLLADLWAQDEPPARDSAFVIAVMERAARRRLWLDIAAMVPFFVAAGVAMWAIAPALAAFAGSIAIPAPRIELVMPVVAAALLASWMWLGTAGRAEA